jgi:PEP-CTERM motif
MKTLTVLVCVLLGVVPCAFGLVPFDAGGAEVPEPGTVILLGSALAGMGYFAWRRGRR